MLAFGAASASVPADDRFYLWLADEGRGNVLVDSGPAGLDLQVEPGNWRDTGPVDQTACIHFDETLRSIAFRDGTLPGNAGTLECWIRPSRFSGTQILFGSALTSTSRLRLSLADRDLMLEDGWWGTHHLLCAQNAFVDDDLGNWAHVAVTWGAGEAGYRIYRDGRLLAERAGHSGDRHTLADRFAFGVNAWDKKSQPFHGDMAQMRIVIGHPLPPGTGTGVDELAFRASLAPLRLVRPNLQWPVGDPTEHLFVRDSPHVATLQITNGFYEALEPMRIAIEVRNRYTGETHSAADVVLEEPLAGRSGRSVAVNLAMPRAGTYEVTARGPGGVSAQARVAWILGPAPEDDTAPVPFFGNSSHHGFQPADWALRREFGSRFERGSLPQWPGTQREPGALEDETVAQTLEIFRGAEHHGGVFYGYSGYTPAFASVLPDAEKSLWDVPRPADYTRWLELAGPAFLPHVTWWEIWNEPNSGGTFFHGTSEQLADLHKAAALALRRSDASLKTIGASTVAIDTNFMDRLQDAGAVDYMDAIAFHNYRLGLSAGRRDCPCPPGDHRMAGPECTWPPTVG